MKSIGNLRAVTCAVWEAVLSAAVVDESNFFELGGDSLAAATIAAEIAERAGLDYAQESEVAVALFETPSLTDFVEALVEIRQL